MPDSIRPQFEATLAAAWPPESWHDVTILVAVSGGADSVALLRAITAIQSAASPTDSTQRNDRLYVAHFNHGLRGKESDADQAFVVDLCERLGVACELGGNNVAALAKSRGDGIEAAAREARYDFLRETARRIGARHVVTAHTADDQAETILHRVIRGTGLSGLAGMSMHREFCDGIALTRPLLQCHRSDIESYLAQLDQPYREDTSNRDLQYTRNRIRRRLLPKLEANYNPGVVDALLRLGQLAGEAQTLVDQQVDQLWETAIAELRPTEARVLSQAFAEVSDFLIRELLLRLWQEQAWPLQQMGLSQWEQLAAMVRGKDPSPVAVSLPGGVTAKKEGEQLLLTRPL